MRKKNEPPCGNMTVRFKNGLSESYHSEKGVSSMRISDIKIDEDFKNCLPDLTKQEYTTLDRNISKHGVMSPFVIWKGFLVDGHNRYSICKAHSIMDVPVMELDADSKDSVIEWILSNQLARRNLTDHQRNVIALRYAEVIKEKANERKLSKLKRGDVSPLPSNDGNGVDRHKTSTNAILGKIAGTSETSIERSKIILSRGTEEQKERAMRGGRGNSVSAISKEIRENEEVYKVCYMCGSVLPIKMMNKANDHGSFICKKCSKLREENRKRRRERKDAESINATIERMKSGESAPYTRNDVYRELVYAADGLVESWRAIIEEHIDIVRVDETVVADAIEYLQDKFKNGGNINVEF